MLHTHTHMILEMNTQYYITSLRALPWGKLLPLSVFLSQVQSTVYGWGSMRFPTSTLAWLLVFMSCLCSHVDDCCFSNIARKCSLIQTFCLSSSYNLSTPLLLWRLSLMCRSCVERLLKSYNNASALRTSHVALMVLAPEWWPLTRQMVVCSLSSSSTFSQDFHHTLQVRSFLCHPKHHHQGRFRTFPFCSLPSLYYPL